MNFGQAIVSGFSHYLTFSGRAPRSELWYFVLFGLILKTAVRLLDAFLFPTLAAQGILPIAIVFSLAMLLPVTSIWIRRLHDIDRTGWWVLITLTGIGAILLIVWGCIKGTKGANRFGPDPLLAGK
jgi:uncharacterized membrane protein YhaH (DUF805 family)